MWSPPACFLLLLVSSCAGQSPIPARYDGFPYGSSGGSVVVEAFFDPLCPDCKEAWPPLKQALHHYAPRLSLILHPFPLPYHDNAFVACRALHIANMLNASSTYPLLELFFEKQERFYNARTHNMSRASIVDDTTKLAVAAIGNSLLPAFRSGFRDPKSDRAARISFNLGCSRGVIGTPFFIVNGFALPNPGSALDFDAWRDIIDPLIAEDTESWEDI